MQFPCSRACSTYKHFIYRGKLLADKLLKQEYQKAQQRSANFMVGTITLFSITLFHKMQCWRVCTNCSSLFHWQCTVDSRRVWPVRRGCLLLHGTWPHLLISEVRVVQCLLNLYMCSGRFWRFWLWYLLY